jgi:hypothetical protein
MRSIGVADMVKAIQKDRVNRCCSGELVSDLVSGTLNLS